MKDIKKLWIILGLVIFSAFFVLGWFGKELYRKVPPIPELVQITDGETLMTSDDILRGRQVWQSIGGQQVGLIWGHVAYQAPDWSADWLHREAVALRDRLSFKHYNKQFDDLTSFQKASIKERLRSEMRTNTYDPKGGTVFVSRDRADAIAEIAGHYLALFSNDPALRDLRESYALHEAAIPDLERRKALTAFFFWTSWATTTERPDMTVTYANDWPQEPLVGNHVTTASSV